jgi:hypothetical protein
MKMITIQMGMLVTINSGHEGNNLQPKSYNMF